MELIIADSDHAYTVALAARLQLWQPGCQIECCCSSQQLHSLIAEHKAKALPVVFLYNSSEFKELGHLAASDVWPKNWQVLAMQDFVPGKQASQFTCRNRKAGQAEEEQIDLRFTDQGKPLWLLEQLLGQPACLGVILTQQLAVFTQGHKAGCSQDTCLAHAATQDLAFAPGQLDYWGWPQQK